jgi:hypothetical protein
MGTAGHYYEGRLPMRIKKQVLPQIATLEQRGGRVNLENARSGPNPEMSGLRDHVSTS